MAPLPHFVCVGIEKCGTTTLHALLDQHPDVYLGRYKEHFFFNQKFDEGLDWYRDRYSTWDGQSTVGDITPSYFRNPKAYDRIHDTLGADTRALLVIRHPLIRAWSHYVHQLCHGVALGPFDTELDRALLAVDPVPVVERFQQTFGDRGRVLVYEDDIAADPLIGFRAACDHLGLEPVAVDASWSNRGVFPSWVHLRAGETVDGLPVRTDTLALRTRPRVMQWELDPTPERVGEVQAAQQAWTRSLDPALVPELTDSRFPGVTDAVEALLGRSLDSWRTPPEVPTYDDAPLPVERLRHVGVLAPASAPDQPTLTEFGGNWIDTPTFAAQLDQRLSDGRFSPELADRVRQFEAEGRIVLPQAMSDQQVTDCMLDLESAFEPASGYLARNKATGLMPASRVRGRARLIDTHINSPAVRQAIFSPPVLEFLQGVFDDDVIAFQSLYFFRGSQQAIHQDTAYVVTDEPLRIAAAWFSLEDVVEGTGELQYYPGSHRHDPYLFSGTHRSFNEGRDGRPQHQEFLQHHHDEAARRGVEAETFLPRRGDALMWHADLAHGGTKITNPDATRHSVVVHYMPLSSRPNYARRGEPYPLHEVVPGGYVSSKNFDVALLDAGDPMRPKGEIDLHVQRRDAEIEPVRADVPSYELRLHEPFDGRGVILHVAARTDGDTIEFRIPRRDGQTVTRTESLGTGEVGHTKLRLLGIDGSRPVEFSFPGSSDAEIVDSRVIELIDH